jgi:hypothetical protein
MRNIWTVLLLGRTADTFWYLAELIKENFQWAVSCIYPALSCQDISVILHNLYTFLILKTMH